MLDSLGYANSTLRPSFGATQFAPGTRMKSCMPRPPPASAVAWHRFLFAPKQRCEEADFAAARSGRARRKLKPAGRPARVPFARADDDRDFEAALAEHAAAMKMMDRDPLGGANTSAGLKDMCLARSLRRLGAPVEPGTPGPFRALEAFM